MTPAAFLRARAYRLDEREREHRADHARRESATTRRILRARARELREAATAWEEEEMDRCFVCRTPTVETCPNCGWTDPPQE